MKELNVSNCKGVGLVKILIGLAVFTIYALSFSGANEHHKRATEAKNKSDAMVARYQAAQDMQRAIEASRPTVNITPQALGQLK